MKTLSVVLAAFLAICFVGGMMGNSHIRAQEANEQKVKKLFESMQNGSYSEQIAFPRLDMTDVPALLENADSTKTLKTFPRNALSSQLELECSEGMVALWLIEGVRQGGKYPSLNALCFKKGVEIKDKTNASEENHKEVSRLYRAWWGKAKTLPPEKAKELGPLKGTDLYWY